MSYSQLKYGSVLNRVDEGGGGGGGGKGGRGNNAKDAADMHSFFDRSKTEGN